MTRKLLANVETRANWTSVAGALEGILAFFDIALDRQIVMGLSGHAFRIAVTDGGDGCPDPDSSTHIDQRRALNLYANLGVAMEYAGASPAAPDFSRRRRDLIRTVTRSIDRGRPVAASGLQVPDFGVIKGYDDRTQVFFVSTRVSAQYGELLPWSQWPPAGQAPPLEVVLPRDRRRVDRRQAERDALRFAVDYARAGDPAGPAGTAHGFAAFAHWLSDFARGERLDRIGNARCVATLQAARRDAAAFLTEIAASQSDAARSAIAAAAAAYREEALALSRLSTLFPYPGGGDVDDPGLRAAGAAALRTAYAWDRAAIDALEPALETL